MTEIQRNKFAYATDFYVSVPFVDLREYPREGGFIQKVLENVSKLLSRNDNGFSAVNFRL